MKSNSQFGLKNVVIKTLTNVCDDLEAPAAARAQAARTLAEVSGLIGRYAETPVDDSRPDSQLSAAELDREIARLREK